MRGHASHWCQAGVRQERSVMLPFTKGIFLESNLRLDSCQSVQPVTQFDFNRAGSISHRCAIRSSIASGTSRWFCYLPLASTTLKSLDIAR